MAKLVAAGVALAGDGRPLFALKLALLFSCGIAAPALGLGQEVTGPLVNALLILAVGLVGVGNAVLLGFTPALIAWMRGVLPAPMALMIPYIALGNALLVLGYAFLARRSYWAGVLLGATLKCAFLWAAVSLVAGGPPWSGAGGLPGARGFAPSLAEMFQYPQLFTALAGGGIAWMVQRGAEALRAR